MIKSVVKAYDKFWDKKPMLFIERFFNGPLFMFLVATFIFVVQALALDVLGYAVICALLCLVCLFFRNTNPTAILYCMIAFCVSNKLSPQPGAYNELSNYYLSAEFITIAIILVSIFFLCLLYRLIAFGDFKKLFSSYAFYGVLVLAVSYLVAGLGSTNFDSANRLMNFVQFFFPVFIAVLVITTFDFTKFNANVISNICLTILLFIDALVIYLHVLEFLETGVFLSMRKGELMSGWGMSNHFGILIATMLPMCFYKMKKSNDEFYTWYAFAVISAIIEVFTFCRSGNVGVLLVFAFGVISAFIDKKTWKKMLIAFLITLSVIAGVIIALVASGEFNTIFKYYIDAGNRQGLDSISSGRLTIWKRFVEYFTEYPIFGQGFLVDVKPNAPIVFGQFAHNTIFQILGSCGIVGILAYVFHLITLCITYFKEMSWDKTFVGVVVFIYTFTGMLDIMFFNPITVMFYVTLICASAHFFEADLSKEYDALKNDEIATLDKAMQKQHERKELFW